MKHYVFILGVLAGAVVLVMGIVYVENRETPGRKQGERAAVAATIYPLYDMARNVAGTDAEIKLILPPGASPHLFEFSPRQLETLQHVKVVFSIGHGLDNWAARITNAVKGTRLIVVDQDIPLRTFEDGTADPHYWLHFGNARRITDMIAKGLSEMDPSHGEAYRARAETYKEKLADEEHELKEVLAPVRGTPILTFHDAWFYFAEEFGLKIAGTFEPAAGEEPAPRDLAGLQRTIAKDHIRVIFIEPQLSTGVLTSFAEDNHVGVATLDPLGGVEGRTTYLDLMAFNARSVRQAIERQR